MLSVQEQLHKLAGRRPGKATPAPHLEGDVVPQQGPVHPVGQQHPALVRAGSNQVGLFGQLDVVRLLGIGPGGVATALGRAFAGDEIHLAIVVQQLHHTAFLPLLLGGNPLPVRRNDVQGPEAGAQGFHGFGFKDDGLDNRNQIPFHLHRLLELDGVDHIPGSISKGECRTHRERSHRQEEIVVHGGIHVVRRIPVVAVLPGFHRMIHADAARLGDVVPPVQVGIALPRDGQIGKVRLHGHVLHRKLHYACCGGKVVTGLAALDARADQGRARKRVLQAGFHRAPEAPAIFPAVGLIPGQVVTGIAVVLLSEGIGGIVQEFVASLHFADKRDGRACLLGYEGKLFGLGAVGRQHANPVAFHPGEFPLGVVGGFGNGVEAGSDGDTTGRRESDGSLGALHLLRAAKKGQRDKGPNSFFHKDGF